MKEIKVLAGQTAWDIAAQYYGSPDGIRQLILDNPDKVNYYDKLLAGTPLLIDTTKIIDQKVVDYFFQPTDGSEALASPPATGFVNKNNWILADGTWNNQGVWVNAETWYNN